MRIEAIDDDAQKPTALRMILGTAGTLAALLIVLAIVRPAMAVKAMHDVMTMIGMAG